jgi:branched-subunit amino acid transport protein
MSTWTAIACVGLVTFLTRASFIVFADPHKFPKGFRMALAFVPPAVLAAIVLPGLAMPAGVLDLTLSNPRWIAGLAALAVAARLRNTLATLVAGMGVLWLLALW